jgi:hypothetical protein
MKILIITQYFWPENFRVNDLAKELNKIYSVSILTGEPNYPSGKIFDEYRLNKKKFSNYSGIPIYRSPIIPRGKNFFQLLLNYLSFIVSSSMFILIKLRKEKYDKIIFFGTSPLTSAYSAKLASAIFKCDFYIWVLDLWPDTLYQFKIFRNNLFNFFLNLILSPIYLSSKKIFVQSIYFIDILSKKFKIEKNKIIFLPSWTENEYLNNRIYYKKNRKFIKIVFSGNLGIAQNLTELIIKLSFLNGTNIKVYLIGEGSKRAEIKKTINKLKLNKNFILLKSYRNNRMPYILKCSDFLLITLKNIYPLNITLPGKFQNYLGIGKPIISISNISSGDIVKKHNLGISTDINNISKKNFKSLLEKIYKDKKKYNNICVNCLNYAKNNFSKKKIINKLVREINSD